MNNKNLLALFGLKWNPFSAELPTEALICTDEIARFCWQVEHLVQEGGFALITGESGLGKSVALRLLEKKLCEMRDITVQEISRPQSNLADFYRELGAAFGIELNAQNLWRGFSALREKWKHHLDTTLLRPVLLIDEAQQVQSFVLSELRLLSSVHFDSKLILTVVLCGDVRLSEKFRDRDLIPLGNRIRTRLALEPYSKEQLCELLKKSLCSAGTPNLMTKELMHTLSEHALGNPRVMNNMANEILMVALKKEASVLDEKLFFEAFPVRKKA